MAFAGIDLKCPLSNKEFLLHFVSKLLGYGVVAGSTTVKIPQILKILKNRSIRGLKIVSFELDVVGYTISLAYCIHKELPFSAFGELTFILIQAIILVVIIYHYSKRLSVQNWIVASLYCCIAPALLTGKVNPALLEALYASQHVIFLFAKIPQLLENFSNKSTGELSFLTCLMNFAGSMVRVFTSIQEKAPRTVLVGSAIAITMNTGILCQMIVYQMQQEKKGKKTEHRN